jgi:hypothetical protein
MKAIAFVLGVLIGLALMSAFPVVAIPASPLVVGVVIGTILAIVV